jgi:hypothetical protein
LEINFKVGENEWLKMPAHIIKTRYNRLMKYLEEENKNGKCPFIEYKK